MKSVCPRQHSNIRLHHVETILVPSAEPKHDSLPFEFVKMSSPLIRGRAKKLHFKNQILGFNGDWLNGKVVELMKNVLLPITVVPYGDIFKLFSPKSSVWHSLQSDMLGSDGCLSDTYPWAVISVLSP